MATTLDAAAVAALLMELSRRTALAGGNPYRARAYARAAESLATLTAPLAAVVGEGRLRTLPGLGLTRITPAGDFRRRSELVVDVALVAEAAGRKAPEVLKTGEMSVTVTDAERFGISLLLATGSEAHLAALRTLAEADGLALTA